MSSHNPHDLPKVYVTSDERVKAEMISNQTKAKIILAIKELLPKLQSHSFRHFQVLLDSVSKTGMKADLLGVHQEVEECLLEEELVSCKMKKTLNNANHWIKPAAHVHFDSCILINISFKQMMNY